MTAGGCCVYVPKRLIWKHECFLHTYTHSEALHDGEQQRFALHNGLRTTFPVPAGTWPPFFWELKVLVGKIRPPTGLSLTNNNAMHLKQEGRMLFQICLFMHYSLMRWTCYFSIWINLSKGAEEVRLTLTLLLQDGPNKANLDEPISPCGTEFRGWNYKLKKNSKAYRIVEANSTVCSAVLGQQRNANVVTHRTS